MKNSEVKDIFLSLVRLGIGTESVYDSGLATQSSRPIDWTAIKTVADEQGLTAVVLDGVTRLGESAVQGPPRIEKLQWIGEVQHWENVFDTQQKAAEEMARLFHENDIRTYVLKGIVISECYPNPNHRVSVDLDCYLDQECKDLKSLNGSRSLSSLRSSKGSVDTHDEAWRRGNELIKARGYDVSDDFYKNSTFYLPGLMVENHLYMTPFRGNKSLKLLEVVLQTMMSDDKGEDRFEGTWLYRPPVMASALFLIEHAYSHFLHEGLTWRMVLDWQMFSHKHKAEIDWTALAMWIDEFGFRKFYDSYHRLGLYLLGELRVESLEFRDKRMLKDVWAPLDLHDTVRGWRGKLALAGNTWRARWKYKYFTNIVWLHALWIQTRGFLFEKEPRLD